MQFGYSPSEFTYTVLVEGLCREYDLAKAKEVLNVMLSREGVDRTRMYNIYLRALCHMNNPTELLNVLVLMFQSQCQPDIISLNTVIKGFCKMGRVEEALQVFDDMIMGKFCAPDEVTYSTIIHGLLNAGKAEKAVYFLRNVMPEKGFSPGVVTYNAVLRGLFKLGLANEAMEVFNNMVCSGVPADCITYTAVIEGLCESKCIDDAKKFWNNVVWPTGVHDNFVYAALLKGLCHLDKFNEACNLLYELADCGVTLNNVNYNIVLDYACELGLKREAYQIVGEMRKNGVVPDAVTWRILDKLHHNSGQPESGGSTAQSVGLKASKADEPILMITGGRSYVAPRLCHWVWGCSGVMRIIHMVNHGGCGPCTPKHCRNAVIRGCTMRMRLLLVWELHYLRCSCAEDCHGCCRSPGETEY
ncbi:UNVERIFIED_CONTAM: hypothetical protein Sradi_3540200 [Sesamum radiatum]|uniref:Pentatricopeptide repeat-containing protein n=1 Tax=Sesamum radiatum TaxID=300843 RepID=A0AAW2QF82_SESRA